MSKELILAHAALETGWGQKVLPGTNNIFNIKASPDWTGPTKTFRVPEERENGRIVMEDSAFRVYDSTEESVADRVKFLRDNPRYGRSGLFDAGIKGDLVKEADALQRAGYATDHTYAAQLVAVFSGPTMQRGIQAVEPDITNKYNAGHALYDQALKALQKYDQENNITVDAQQTQNVAASLAVSAQRSGLTKIDHATFGGNDGGTIFAIQGQPGSVRSKIADAPTVESLNTPLTQSSQAFNATHQAQLAAWQQGTQQSLQQPAQTQAAQVMTR